MATTVLTPTRIDISRYSMRLELSGVVFGLEFIYNVRESHWYLTVLDSNGVALREGLKLVANWLTIWRWIQQGRPVGDFMAVNPNADDDPTRETLGVDTFLSYVTP